MIQNKILITMYRLKKYINFLYRNSFISSTNPAIKIFGYLLLLTILSHVIAWRIMILTKGEIWILAERSEQMKNLFFPGLDGGYFEHFQYILLLWCAFLSGLIFLRQSRNIISIPIIYLFLFLDDSLSLHDRALNILIIPNYLESVLSKQEIFRVKDFAEVSYWLIVLFVIIFLSFRSFKSAPSKVKDFMRTNYLFFVALAFFASFIDIINSNIIKWMTAFGSPEFIAMKVRNYFYVLEECGEITVIALACSWLFTVACNRELLTINSSK